MKKYLLLLLFVIPCCVYMCAQTWNAIGSGYYNGSPSCLNSLEKLYIGGGGNNGCTLAGFPANGIISFDGSAIDSLGPWGIGDYAGYADDAEWYNGKLIVGGHFLYAGPDQWAMPHTEYLAAWDSTSGWSSITPVNSPDYWVNAVQEYHGNLYIGGSFVHVNNVTCQRIAKWNGTGWSAVGGGFSGACEVNCMAIYHDQLYVGGQIGLPNGPNNYYYYIARWNGTQWDSVGNSGMNYPVYSLVVDTVNDVLIAGGGFTQAGGFIDRGVAQWNDTVWTPVGSGLDTLWGTKAVAVYNNEVYACGGNVTVTSLGDTIKNVYKYNGTKWVSVDGGANNTALHMTVFQNNLYVGGLFTRVGSNGLIVEYIACYGNSCPTSVGIPEINYSEPFSVFPNPSSGVFTLQSDLSSAYNIQIFNSLGEEIFYREKINDHSFPIDLSIEPSGIYLVRVSCNGNVVTKKIIKE